MLKLCFRIEGQIERERETKRERVMVWSCSFAMDMVAWRGLMYTGFILHFVFVCQLLLLQPLVSALGLFHSLFDLYLHAICLNLFIDLMLHVKFRTFFQLGGLICCAKFERSLLCGCLGLAVFWALVKIKLYCIHCACILQWFCRQPLYQRECMVVLYLSILHSGL